jgi:hypothetical protein
MRVVACLYREFGVPQPWYFPVLPSYWREVFNFGSDKKASASNDALIAKGSGSGVRFRMGEEADADDNASTTVSLLGASGGPSKARSQQQQRGWMASVSRWLPFASTVVSPTDRVHNGVPADASYFEEPDHSLRAKVG